MRCGCRLLDNSIWHGIEEIVVQVCPGRVVGAIRGPLSDFGGKFLFNLPNLLVQILLIHFTLHQILSTSAQNHSTNPALQHLERRQLIQGL